MSQKIICVLYNEAYDIIGVLILTKCVFLALPKDGKYIIPKEIAHSLKSF